jgi:hypothetical protein
LGRGAIEVVAGVTIPTAKSVTANAMTGNAIRANALPEVCLRRLAAVSALLRRPDSTLAISFVNDRDGIDVRGSQHSRINPG